MCMKMNLRNLVGLLMLGLAPKALAAVPTPPTSVVSTTLSETSIQIRWGNTDLTASGIGVMRQKNLGAWEVLPTTLIPTTNSFTDIGLEKNAYYCYSVFAVNGEGRSVLSDMTCSITIKQTEGIPYFAAIGRTSPTTVALSWTVNQPTQYSFRIQQRPPSGGWATIAEVSNQTSFAHAGLNELTTYCYRIQAFRTGFTSDWSSESCQTTYAITPSSINSLLFAPHVDDPDRALTATWTPGDILSGVVYELQTRVVGSATWHETRTVEIPAFTLTSLPNTTTYEIRVRARRSIGGLTLYSEWSAAVSAKTWLTIWPGDANGDGTVNQQDILIITDATRYGSRTPFTETNAAQTLTWTRYPVNPPLADYTLLRADANRDGVADVYDLLVVVAHYNKTGTSAQAALASRITSAEQADVIEKLLLQVGNAPETAALRADLNALLKAWRPDVEPTAELPKNTQLRGIYPNPFRSTATVAWDLAQETRVQIEVWNVLGQKVVTVLDESRPAGSYTASLPLDQQASGTYLVRFTADQVSKTFLLTKIR